MLMFRMLSSQLPVEQFAWQLIVKVELGPLTVPLPVEFCSLTVDGCEGAEPACSAMKAGDKIKLCSSLTVPTQSPDVTNQTNIPLKPFLSSIAGQRPGHVEGLAGEQFKWRVWDDLWPWWPEIERQIPIGLYQDSSQSPGPKRIELRFFACYFWISSNICNIHEKWLNAKEKWSFNV